MYLEFFGLKEKPFSLTPDPKFFFQSETHKANLEQALYGIMHREGFIVVTGAIGAGKTTLCRTIYDKLDRKTHTAMILNPFLSEDELLETVLHEFGILEKGGQRLSKKEMLDKLNEFLLNTLKGGENAILIIDEAQNLPMPALEQIRILSNLETDKEKLLQIILVGQLGLLRLLNSPELQQLDQRIPVKCQINPLKKEEVQRYIEYRITVAGSSGEVAFAPDALDLIYEYSLGIPRVINLICDRSLLGAYTQQTTKINKALVLKAVENLKLEKPVMSKQKMAELTSGVPPAATASATPGGPSKFSSSKVRLPFIIGGSVVVLTAFGFLIFVLIQGKGIRATLERQNQQHQQEASSLRRERARLEGERSRLEKEMADLKEQVETLRTRPSATSPVAVSEELKDSFTIFLGVFKDKDSAVEKGASLKELGYKAYVVGLSGTSPEKQYRLVLGSFKEKEEAEKVLARLHNRAELMDARVMAFSEISRVD